jgi:hypothetical protein
MKKLLLVAAVMLFAASSAHAVVYTYSWEDNFGTVLGTYGNVSLTEVVTGMQNGQDGLPTNPYSCPGAYDGMYYLHAQESPHYSTPQCFVACITGLQQDDQVYASFWGYDITPGASPSWRIWGHYSDAQGCPDCPGTYTGSASGPSEYTDGLGWGITEHTWTYAPPNDGDALEIEARIYSTPSTCDTCLTDMWCDLVTVDIPAYAAVVFPDFDTSASATEPTDWGQIKALFR